ncbi:MAG TPA: hypothetical protein VFA78_04035 [Chloroflexota bacterium]|nr:hypothetical protein [Chloroflexota bacterium]
MVCGALTQGANRYPSTAIIYHLGGKYLVRAGFLLFAVTLVLAGCGSGSAPPTPAPPTATSRPQPTTSHASPTPNPTYLVGKPYATFLHTICNALAAGNSGTIIANLPHYEYNSGVRYGTYGAGPGQTGDPSLIHTWLTGARPRCRFYTPGVEGHGAILTSGWKMGANHWAILEADLFSHKWRINDFTFGPQSKLHPALHIAGPVLMYHV